MKKSGVVFAVALAALSGCARSAADGEEAGATEALTGARDGAKTALYAGICGFSLASYDPGFAIRFYVETSTTPADGTSAETLTVRMTPLVGWDLTNQRPAPPTAVTRAQTCGYTITSSSQLTDGAFSTYFGRLDIPPVGNSINGVDARIANLQLDGPFQDDATHFCAGLSGSLVEPVQYTLKRDENTCLFVKVSDGDPLPALTDQDFHCP